MRQQEEKRKETVGETNTSQSKDKTLQELDGIQDDEIFETVNGERMQSDI